MNLFEIQERQLSLNKSERNYEIAGIKEADMQTFEPQLSQRTADQADKNVTPDTEFVKKDGENKPKRFRIKSIMNKALGTEDFGNYDYQDKKGEELFVNSEKLAPIKESPKQEKIAVPQPEKDPFALEKFDVKQHKK